MPNKTYLQVYLDELIGRGNEKMAKSIEITAKDFAREELRDFSFVDHEIGLLFGNVQAGKTAQVFGIICAATDESFPLFILLTTDSVSLQKQTFDRVEKDLSNCGFCVCNEADKQKFIDNSLAKPTIIVLKKNSSVLLQWYNTLASSSFVKGNALFIIDDEADAASLNTLINSNRVSTINRRLSDIRDASIGSIYLQVTGTPQALLLQSSLSNFRPAFTYYFEPGESYLGGDFFFSDNSHVRFLDDLNSDDETGGLLLALLHHLVVSSQLFLSGDSVCNFVIHPGVRKASHNKAKKLIMNLLRYIRMNLENENLNYLLESEYKQIQPKNSEKRSFINIKTCINKLLAEGICKVLVMNADNSVDDSNYNSGANIIIGGNILGRGVTFPKLQTLYYTRSAKKPQADTMWQHSRMFGYDRDPGLMQVFITKALYKLFADINAGNNSIINQINKGLDKIQIIYPEGLNPTRRNVIDMKMVNLVAGGTNYYPNDPENDDISMIDKLLEGFDSEGYYQVNSKFVLTVLSHIKSSEDFNIVAFVNVIKAQITNNPGDQSILIVRRDRQITQGTGTLLSPNDRNMGSLFKDQTVLTMYKINGGFGWKQENIWVPNIKLPEFINYYDVL